MKLFGKKNGWLYGQKHKKKKIYQRYQGKRKKNQNLWEKPLLFLVKN